MQGCLNIHKFNKCNLAHIEAQGKKNNKNFTMWEKQNETKTTVAVQIKLTIDTALENPAKPWRIFSVSFCFNPKLGKEVSKQSLLCLFRSSEPYSLPFSPRKSKVGKTRRKSTVTEQLGPSSRARAGEREEEKAGGDESSSAPGLPDHTECQACHSPSPRSRKDTLGTYWSSTSSTGWYAWQMQLWWLLSGTTSF